MSRNQRDHKYNRNRDFEDKRSRTRQKHEGQRNYGHPNENGKWRKGEVYGDHQAHRRNNHSYNRRDDWNRQTNIIKVNEMDVELPKVFVISDQSHQFRGKFHVDIKSENHYPKLDQTRLGELKNKITPIEKIWTSHVKQFLNISEFVEIYRKGKSLANGRIQYGRSIINYDEGACDMVYSNEVQQSQIFSRAYFKLWEILELGVLQKYKDTPLTIGCVAEGPGGFIHALIDYRERQHKGQDYSPKDKYYAITLKIGEGTRNAKDWSDNRAQTLFNKLKNIGFKIHFSYGKTETGDLLNIQNIEYFANEIGKKCPLVTGDGGIECRGDKQFEYQQIFNCKLFFGEIITAFHIQETDGTFILKIYDCGFDITRQLILLLALYYRKVSIVKPITSRPGNSEKYLLCQGFIGISLLELNELKQTLIEWVKNQPNLSYFQNKQFLCKLFQFSHIPNFSTVYDNIIRSNNQFVQQQQQKIEEGLKLIEQHSTARSIQQELNKTRFQEQTSFAYAWCKKYGLPTIEVEIVPKNE